MSESPMERFWRRNPAGHRPGAKLWKHKKRDAAARARERWRLSEKGKAYMKAYRQKKRDVILEQNRVYKEKYRSTEKWQKDFRDWYQRIKSDGRLKKWQKVSNERKKEIRAGNERWRELMREEFKWQKVHKRTPTISSGGN